MAEARKLINRIWRQLDLDAIYEMTLPADEFLEKIGDALEKAQADLISDHWRTGGPGKPDLVFKVKTGSSGYEGGLQFTVYGFSEEDDTEYGRRIAAAKKVETAVLLRKQKAAQRAKEKADRLAAEEKAEYERLKAKYG